MNVCSHFRFKADGTCTEPRRHIGTEKNVEIGGVRLVMQISAAGEVRLLSRSWALDNPQ